MVNWIDPGGEYEKELRSYFLCCPICASDRMTARFSSGGKDMLHCDVCGAKWHVHMGLSGFKWAELELAAKDGKGQELLGKHYDKNEIKQLAQTAVIVPTKSKSETTKEIIKEKEVIVKIRCPYCHHTYNEILDRCPNCSGKN
jgi:formate dehydrogenase maturation protein FdhE